MRKISAAIYGCLVVPNTYILGLEDCASGALTADIRLWMGTNFIEVGVLAWNLPSMAGIMGADNYEVVLEEKSLVFISPSFRHGLPESSAREGNISS